MHTRSPSYPQSYHQSPSLHSPSLSTPPAGHQHVGDVQPPTPTGPFPHTAAMNAAPMRQSRGQLPPPGYQGPAPQPGTGSYSHYPAQGPGYSSSSQTAQGPVLPPFSSIQTMGPPSSQQANVSSIRYDNGHPQAMPRQHSGSGKRHAPGSANVTSADSSDIDEEDTGELPDSGLVAPLEVLRGLADVASERAAKVPYNGYLFGPHTNSTTGKRGQQWACESWSDTIARSTKPSSKAKKDSAPRQTHLNFP